MNKKENELSNLLKDRKRLERRLFATTNFSFWKRIRQYTKLILKYRLWISLLGSDWRVYESLTDKVCKYSRDFNLVEEHVSISINPLVNSSLHKLWVDKLKNFDKRLRERESFLILQGSYSDGKITNYSDLDLVLIYKYIHPEIIRIKAEVESFILKVDPLQHHGVFTIHESTFSHYWEMDLPLIVLSQAKNFSDDVVQLHITGVLVEHASAESWLISSLDGLEKVISMDYKELGVWKWKFILSIIMLMPTMLLGALGRSIYKEQSFEKVKEKYSEKAWSVIEMASKVRDQWPDREHFAAYRETRVSANIPVINEHILVREIPSITFPESFNFQENFQQLVLESKSILNGR
jgi:hypothetical protein